MYHGEKGDYKMPLGITREEAAYILALIECDIIPIQREVVAHLGKQRTTPP